MFLQSQHAFLRKTPYAVDVAMVAKIHHRVLLCALTALAKEDKTFDCYHM